MEKIISNYVKLMKAIVKTSKNTDAKKLFIQNHIDTNMVYMSDGCVVFGIPYNIYKENYLACKCPDPDTAENKLDLRKLIADVMNNNDKIECKFTTMLFNIYNDKLVKVYKINNDFGVINKVYADMISLLPTALCGYMPFTLKKNSPIAFYNNNIDSGYAICPINFDVKRAIDEILK